jgi:hypothetical protein
MSSRGLRALLIAALAPGPLGISGGCGGQESGTTVQVNKEQEKAVLKSMENYMKKMQTQPRGQGRPIK